MNIQLISEPKTIMSNSKSLHDYFGWPTAVRLRNGKIAVAASGFRLDHVCPFGKAVIAYSEDDGETFTHPAPVIDTVLDDRDGGLCPFGESGLIITSFNNSVEFQRKSNAKRKNEVKKAYIDAYLDTVNGEREAADRGYTFRISRDHGVTFGPVLKSPVTSPHGPTELSDGSIVWVGTSGGNGGEIRAYRLDPASGNMEHIGTVDTGGIKALGRIPSEPYAIELEDKRLLCHIRADRYKEERAFTLYQTESTDGGRTWSIPKQLLADKGGAPCHMLKHSSGALIATYGYRESPYGIKAMFSYDGGKSWSEGEYLYSTQVSSDLGYPSTVELADGSLLTVFYAKQSENGAAIILSQKWKFA